jgi:hypothetical protein
MKVFHPGHRTAWSHRTSGYPLVAVRASGGIENLGGTRTRACRIEVPEDTVAILWCYTSGSGRRTVYVLAPENGLPERARIVDDGSSPEEIRAALGAMPESALEWVVDRLWE